MSDFSPEDLFIKFAGITPEEIESDRLIQQALKETLANAGITLDSILGDVLDKVTLLGMAVQQGDPQAVGLFILTMLGWLKTQT